MFDISSVTEQISWSGDYHQCARELNFGFLSSPTDKNIPAVKCELGNIVTLMQDNRLLFEGYVFERNRSTNSSTMNVTCYDRGIYLKRNRASYKFINQTPEDITKRVCGDFGINFGEVIGTGIKITRNFIGLSLYDIIQTAYTLASAETKKKYYLTFKGSSLYVSEKKANDETLVIEGLIDAAMSDSITDMVNQVAIHDSNDKFIRNVKNDEYIRLYGLMQDYMKQPDSKSVESKAQSLIYDNGIQQRITINNLGNAANITGGTVVVHEPYTGVYGLFYIDSDVHTWKKGLYLNKLVLNFKNIMDEKEAGSLPNKSG